LNCAKVDWFWFLTQTDSGMGIKWIFHYRPKWCPDFPVVLLLIVSYYSQINIIE
jgi:hypothetical protein